MNVRARSEMSSFTTYINGFANGIFIISIIKTDGDTISPMIQIKTSSENDFHSHIRDRGNGENHAAQCGNNHASTAGDQITAPKTGTKRRHHLLHTESS